MTTGPAATITVVVETAIPPGGDPRTLESLVRHALAAEGATGEWDVTVALMSDHEVRRLHREFMGLDTATDIMTFPRGDGERGGDIAISVDRATAQAPEFGMSAWEEVCFLAVHGVLHLTGWDDGDDEARRLMLERQAAILASWTGA